MAEHGAFFQYDPSVGVVIPDTLTVRERIVELFKNAFGASFVTENSTPAGVLVDSLAKMFAEQCGIVAQSANGFNVNLAQGRWLDAIGSLLGLPRHSDTNTYVRIGIKSANTTLGVDAGSVVVEDGFGNRFTNDEPFSFSESKNVVSVKFVSVLAGRINYTLAGMSVRNNPDLSVSYVGDFAPRLISEGMATETDLQYRTRILSATARSRGYAESVKNAIMEADGAVKSVAVGSNCRTAYVFQDGIVYPPNSVAIVVEGYSNAEAIENAIRASVPFGVSYAKTVGGAQHIFWVDPAKEDVSGYRGFWHEAKSTEILVRGKCTMINYIGDKDSAQAEIKSLLDEYFSAIGVGAKVSPSQVGVFLRGRMHGVDISDVAVSIGKDEQGDQIWFSDQPVQVAIFNFLVPSVEFEFSREEA